MHYIHILMIVLGFLFITSIAVVPMGIKLVKQLRDREEEIDGGVVVVLYLYFLGLGLSAAIGLACSLILSGALGLTSFVVAPAGLKLLKQLRDREEQLDAGSIVILFTYFISLGLTIALGIYIRA